MPKHTAVNGATSGRVAGGVVAEAEATMGHVAPVFNPFTATLDDARALLDEPDGARLVGAIVGAQTLLANRAFYERHPIDGMAVCARNDLVAPDWLAKAFLRGFDAVLNCRVGSWDEAFGEPYPGKQLAQLRRRRVNRIKVTLAVSAAMQSDPEQAVDVGFWERIGASVGEGKSQAQTLHAEAVDASIAWGTASEIGRSLRLPKKSSPTKSRKLTGLQRQG